MANEADKKGDLAWRGALADNLLPCPFCGGEMENRVYIGAVHVDGKGCPIGDLAITPDKWNRRAWRPGANPAIAGRLQQALDEMAAIIGPYGLDKSNAYKALRDARTYIENAEKYAAEQEQIEIMLKQERAKRGAAEAALEPFGVSEDAIEAWAGVKNVHDASTIFSIGNYERITVGHLRAARRVLNGGAK